MLGDKDYALGLIYARMEPYLIGTKLLPHQSMPGQSYKYQKQDENILDDEKLKGPKDITASTVLPKIDLGFVGEEVGGMNRVGYSIDLDADAYNDAGDDMIGRGLDRLAIGLAGKVNADIFGRLLAGGRADNVTSYSDWTAEGANPVSQLRDAKNAMRQAGFAYKATDAFVTPEAWEALEKDLFFTDYGGEKQNRLMGWPDAGYGDSLFIPGLGINVSRIDAGIPKGKLLMFDRNNPGATLFYNTNPMYSNPDIVYPTVVDGEMRSEVVPNFGLHIDTYFTNDRKMFTIDAWVRYGIGVLDPKALLVGTGIEAV